MIDFPASPLNGQVFMSGGSSWTFDGTKWAASGTVIPPIVTGDNRIINGDMRIDQRNNGASGTANGYTVDRWQYGAAQATKGTWQRVAVASLPGWPYCLGFTSNSAYTPLTGDTFYFEQSIEADMVSDFQWGTSAAQSVTLSFWAWSTLTGTFSGSFTNDISTRSYPFSYSLPTANTWTKIAITIPGDTAGAWVMSSNAKSMNVFFELGGGATFRAPAGAWTSGNIIGANGAVSVVATNNAQFLLTGVKLEVGSVATPYNRQSLAKSMADCQRYYSAGNMDFGELYGAAGRTYQFGQTVPFLVVTMRASPR